MATINIISEQSGVAQFTASQTLTVSISAVNNAHSILFFNVSGGDSSPSNSLITGVLDELTDTLTFERIGTAGAPEVQWQVIEFDNSVNVQRGVQVDPFNNPTFLLGTAVDLSRSIIISNGVRNTGSTTGTDDFVRFSFLDSTTVNFEQSASNAASAVSFQVVEFPANAISSVNYYSGSTTGATTPITISSVDYLKTLLFGTSKTASNAGGNTWLNAELTSATNFNVIADATNSPLQFGVFVIEFVDYDVTHGSTGAWTNQLSVDHVLPATPAHGSALISGVNNRPGLCSHQSTDDDFSIGGWTATRTGATWTFSRSSNTANSRLSYSLIDWGQGAGAGISIPVAINHFKNQGIM